MYPTDSDNRQPPSAPPDEPASRPAERRDAPPVLPDTPEGAAVHRIRLRHPWHSQATPHGTRWQRQFNRPTGLGPAQRVWIVVRGIAAPGSAALNGKTLGTLSAQADTPTAFDVTDLLRPHNRLELELDTPAAPGASRPTLPGQVWIEIHGQ